MSVQTIPFTTNFQDQKPGTSGLRKKVKVFQQPQYTESFIQATLTACTPKQDSTEVLVVGGDGRFFNKSSINSIVKIAAANKIKKLIIGQHGILSTPAASHLIRKLKATGGILLTASHNPGGPENDFGIKYNVSNGGPAPENITEKIYKETLHQKSYKTITSNPNIDLTKIATTTVPVTKDQQKWELIVDVVDSSNDYVALMKEIFDFGLIKKFLSDGKFKVLFDSMHGVTGPYTSKIFIQELGLPPTSLINNIPSETFNSGHPDPNLTYAHELVEKVEAGKYDLGAASDGDGDRNMIVACNGCFVNPSDSVAVIASNASLIPYFKKTGIKGLARSMPTSASIDRVAEKKGYKIYEVPTGWKFFGNLMDAGKLSICGEESFGTGSDHIREKDGIWAVLAWLNIIAALNLDRKSRIGINDVLLAHWKEYGRNYFTRYDFEEVSGEAGNALMLDLRASALSGKSKGKVYEAISSLGVVEKYTVDKIEDFSYTDPIDASVSTKQGIQIFFTDGSRIVYRLSGTGSSGATIRIYIEKYEKENVSMKASDGLSALVDIALKIGRIEELTGRKVPTVIT